VSSNPQPEGRDRYEAAIERAKTEIIAALPRPESKAWKLATLVIPIVLTSVLGLWIYMIQTRLQTYLQTRLGLTQDYYRERLKTMQSVHSQLIALRDKATTAPTGSSAADAGLDDSIVALHRSYSDSSLFLSNVLLARLGGLWQQSVAVLRSDRIADKELAEITAAVSGVEEQMRSDLLIDADNLLASTKASPRAPARP
jgi:hypothetical protein